MFAGCSQSRAGESSDDVQASGTTVDDVGGVSSDGADVTDSSDGVEGQDGLSSTDNATGSDGTSSSEDCEPDCPSGQVCKDGACEQPIICEPGTYVCDGLTAKKQCNTTGTGFLEPEQCPGEQLCSSGQCGLKCNLDPKWGAYVGCVFWTVDLPVWKDPSIPNAPNLPHAIVVSNPSEQDATVTFTPPPGVQFSFNDLTIPGGGNRVFEFPPLSLSGNDIYDLGIRVESNRPVLVHQFNPWDNTYSNDASLLLPEPLLGSEYVVLSWPTDARSLLEIPGLEGFGGPSVLSYVSVVAPYDDTSVTVRSSARIQGTEIPEGSTEPQTVQPMYKGGIQTFTLNTGQVLNLSAMPDSLFETADMTGTIIISDKPVAVFSGHESAGIAPPNPSPGAQESCCLDHLEEQMLPVSLLGQDYVAVKSKERGGEPDLWRIVAGDVGVTITTNPPISGLDGVTLAAKGDWVQAFTDQSFVINATGKIQVGQYLVAQEATDSKQGDPSLMLAIPTERFRNSYPIMVPDTYEQNYVTIVRAPGTTVSVDGITVEPAIFEPVAGGAWERAWVKVEPGYHVIEGTDAFGLTAYGYAPAASYGYPGGMSIPGEDSL
jgi:hypothetical protein